MTYRGDQEPSILDEPVELKYQAIETMLAAYLAFSFSMHVILPGLLTAAMVERRPPLEGILFFDIFFAFLFAFAVGIIIHYKRRKTFLTVDSVKLVTTRQGKVLQDCRWDDVTVKVDLFGRRILVDQNEKAFPFIWMRGKPIGSMLVRQIRRTKLRRSAEPTMKSNIILALWIAAGILPFILFLPLLHNWTYTITSLHATKVDKWISVGLFSANYCLAYCWWPVIFALQNRYELRIGPPREIRNFSEANALIDKYKGILNPVDMGNGIWFRHARGLDRRLMTGQVLAVLALGLTILGILYGSTMTNEPEFNSLPLFLLASSLISLFVIGTLISLLLKRLRLGLGLEAEIAKDGDFFLIRSKNQVERATQVEAKLLQTANLSFGSNHLDLRTDGGKIYSFDPRYLVPVDTEKP